MPLFKLYGPGVLTLPMAFFVATTRAEQLNALLAAGRHRLVAKLLASR